MNDVVHDRHLCIVSHRQPASRVGGGHRARVAPVSYSCTARPSGACPS
ncbi:hypothetical protein DLM_1935 [Aquitalea magnusonii]|uniref:Uncharacterized protein n=1 Tax=Aquitalea magnusonii TaxID=332411 RepID=A0A3G9GH26_9NEIS|nr:hypothetical protein DLM_1935 [Aquitalea magnusonii]